MGAEDRHTHPHTQGFMTSSGSWSDQLEWVKEGGSNILKKPCVRNALMAGIATGTMMGIHKFRVGSEWTPSLLPVSLLLYLYI